MRDAFVARLASLAAADPSIMLITADLGFGVLTQYATELPRQYLNVGVAEQNMIGVATGLALEGRTVFVYSIANFPTLRCLEQIRNDVCYHDANVKVVAVGGGFSYGGLGMSHHATEDLAILRALPNMTVVAPTTQWEASEATAAIAALHGPCYLRLDKSIAKPNHAENERFHLGRLRVIRDGVDVALLACGGIMENVLGAADILHSAGVSAKVVSAHTVKPLDAEALLRVTHGMPIVTIEEHNVIGGLGGAVAEIVAEQAGLSKGLLRIGVDDAYTTVVGSQDYLRASWSLNAHDIARRTQDAIHRWQVLDYNPAT